MPNYTITVQSNRGHVFSVKKTHARHHVRRMVYDAVWTAFDLDSIRDRQAADDAYAIVNRWDGATPLSIRAIYWSATIEIATPHQARTFNQSAVAGHNATGRHMTTTDKLRVKKGDIVALAKRSSVTYATSLGRGTETAIFFTLMRVGSASRDGEATSLQCARGGTAYLKRRDYALSDVRVISDARQSNARRLFEHLTATIGWETHNWDIDQYPSADALRSAILEA